MKFLLFLVAVFGLTACSNFSLDQIEGVREDSAPLNVRWAKNLDPIYETGNLPIHLGAPVISGERLFMSNGSGDLTVYALSDGRELWSVKDGGTSHAAALVSGDTVYYGTADGRLYSRKATDGTEQWVIDLGASIEAQPTFANGRLFVHLRNHQIFALDASTGKILWAYKRSVPLLTTLQRAAKPVIWNNKLYLGFADGTVASFNVEEGVMLWERKISTGDKFIDVDMTPTFFNSQLWIGSSSGELHVLDPKTGRNIRTVDLISSHQPLQFGESLLYGTNRGELVGVNSNGKIVMRHLVADAQISSVEKWKDGFVVTDVEANLYYVLNDGSVSWRKHLGHSASGIFAKPAVSGDRYALLSSRHRLYVFQ